MRHTYKIFLLSIGILFFNDSLCQDRDTSLPNLIPYRKGDLWGYCDKNKNLIIQAKYSLTEPFIAGKAIVHFDNKKYGLIDSLGTEWFTVGKDTMIIIWNHELVLIERKLNDVIYVLNDGAIFKPEKYKIEYPFFENMFVATKRKKHGVVDNKENVIISFNYRLIANIDDKGYALVENKKGQRGFINRNGKTVIPYFEKGVFIGGFFNDRALIGIGESFKQNFGYIDRTGKVVVPVQYKEALPFDNDLAIVGDDKMRGIINLNGDTLLPFKYTGLYRLENNLISFSDSLGSGVMKSNGEILFRKKDNYIYTSIAGHFFVYELSGWEGNTLSIRKKVLDAKGNELPGKYRGFVSAWPGLVSVIEESGLSYFMDFRGNKYYED